MEIESRTSKAVSEHGWECISVWPEQDGEFDFSYSIGFEERFGHPELAIFGLPSELASRVLAKAYKLISGGRRFEIGSSYDDLVSERVQIMVVGSAHQSRYGEYFGGIRRYYGRDVPILVLIWPNKQGVFPAADGEHPQREAFVIMSESDSDSD